MTPSTMRIGLRDLQFHARIGVSEQERSVGNDFRVDLELTIDTAGFKSEDLDSTVNYALVYEAVAGIMAREWLLLESAAIGIRDLLLHQFPKILHASVTIAKLHPPINGITGEAYVRLD